MTIFNLENIHFGLSRRLVPGKHIFNFIINPWLTFSVGRGFFISSNSRRFTHPRPTQKIGYQIGVLGIDKVVIHLRTLYHKYLLDRFCISSLTVQMSKLGIGVTHAFREQRASVDESYVKNNPT